MREIKYLTRDEWKWLRLSVVSLRDGLILDLLYTTGMRVNELVQASIEDIDFGDRFIKIPAEHTKTQVARSSYIPQEVLNNLKGYLKIMHKKQGSIFGLKKRRIQQIVEKYSEKSKVKATPHTLRHTHIVHALLDKVPVAAVQKQVGHKRLETTQIYADLAPEQVREAYERRSK